MRLNWRDDRPDRPEISALSIADKAVGFAGLYVVVQALYLVRELLSDLWGWVRWGVHALGLMALLILLPGVAHAQSLKIQWDHPGADSYVIYRSQSATTGFTRLATTPGTARTYTDAGPLTPGQTYSYRVTALLGAAESSASNTITQTVAAPPTAPPPPGSPVITLQTTGASGVCFGITWAPSSGATGGYDWTAGYNDGSSGQTGTTAQTGLSLCMPYHASGQAADGWFGVSARTSTGVTSEPSSNALHVPAKPAGPSFPAPSVASKNTACDVTLRVPAPDSSPGWTAQFRQDAGTAFGTKDSSPPYERSKTGIKSGTQVYVEWLKGGVLVGTSPKTTVVCP